MLDTKVRELINTQINKEFYSAYLYLDFANYYKDTLEKLMDPLKAGLVHEEYVTGLINTIYDAAQSVKDFRTMQFLDWFIKEQGEEETNAHDLITKMELFGTDPKGLYMLDNELKARVYTAPSLVI